jgi:hypothetical protein
MLECRLHRLSESKSLRVLAALFVASAFSTGASIAQPSPQVLERLRAMGLSPDMKAPPAWAIPEGVKRNDTVPSNFPIPIYRSNVYNTTFYNTTKGSPSASVSISTKDQPEIVYRFYQSQLISAGWRTQVPTPEALAKMGVKGQYYMINGTKEIQVFNLTIRSNPQVAGSVVSINWYINQNQTTK